MYVNIIKNVIHHFLFRQTLNLAFPRKRYMKHSLHNIMIFYSFDVYRLTSQGTTICFSEYVTSITNWYLPMLPMV